MRIRLNIQGRSLTAALAQHATSSDFVSLLPLTLTLEVSNSEDGEPPA